MKKLMMRALLIALIFLISGCGKEYITPQLPMPEKPDMPTITNADIQCVEDAAYWRIARRDLAHRQYAGRLEAVIKSTWDK